MKLVIKSAELTEPLGWVWLTEFQWRKINEQAKTNKKTTQEKQVKGCSSHQRKIQFSSKLTERDLVLFAMKTHHCGWNSKAVGRNKRSLTVQDARRQQALRAETLLLSSTAQQFATISPVAGVLSALPAEVFLKLPKLAPSNALHLGLAGT